VVGTEQEAEQGLREAARELRGLHLHSDEPPYGQAFGPLMRLFGQFRRALLGSSLSSGAARRCPRVRHEAPEDGVTDAPLEASQRLLAGLALCHLLAVVGPAPNVRSGLAYRDHMQGALLSLRLPASESL